MARKAGKSSLDGRAIMGSRGQWLLEQVVLDRPATPTSHTSALSAHQNSVHHQHQADILAPPVLWSNLLWKNMTQAPVEEVETLNVMEEPQPLWLAKLHRCWMSNLSARCPASRNRAWAVRSICLSCCPVFSVVSGFSCSDVRFPATWPAELWPSVLWWYWSNCYSHGSGSN